MVGPLAVVTGWGEWIFPIPQPPPLQFLRPSSDSLLLLLLLLLFPVVEDCPHDRVEIHEPLAHDDENEDEGVEECGEGCLWLAAVAAAAEVAEGVAAAAEGMHRVVATSVWLVVREEVEEGERE